MATEHEELTRAAKLRAAVVAHLREQNKWMTQRQISEDLAPLITELEYTNTSTVYAVFNAMVANGQILMKKIDDLNHYAYPGTSNGQVMQAAAALKPVKKAEKAEIPPAVSIDIVKATGKVRLTVQGICIEIGVVEK